MRSDSGRREHETVGVSHPDHRSQWRLRGQNSGQDLTSGGVHESSEGSRVGASMANTPGPGTRSIASTPKDHGSTSCFTMAIPQCWSASLRAHSTDGTAARHATSSPSSMIAWLVAARSADQRADSRPYSVVVIVSDTLRTARRRRGRRPQPECWISIIPEAATSDSDTLRRCEPSDLCGFAGMGYGEVLAACRDCRLELLWTFRLSAMSPSSGPRFGPTVLSAVRFDHGRAVVRGDGVV
jgi:hypothetical protein